MSGEVASGAARARPLSGGLWTLFSWLRREEHSSSDSLSSAGSARTAASFAFLAPALYAAPAPARRDPPPPSDSYRRRVRERSLRRLRDRDLTLHRKYGLYGLAYDAHSLPSERDRRAASESPRAHVPGKRRAPPPPVASASLPRARRARKRPAPLPPLPRNDASSPRARTSASGPMSPPSPDDRPRGRDAAGTGCKPEKYSKKDAPKETKDVKLRHEKSFLKQIFENRKRNSVIETSAVKLLPSISELDKQAAEMIEKYRLKECTPTAGFDKEFGNNEPGSSKRQTDAWICTRCLRKYDSSVITCNYCLPLNKVNDPFNILRVSNTCTQTNTNKINNIVSDGVKARVEDKEKLKEMLKEMKDSLPKRPKNDLITARKPKSATEREPKEDYPIIVEAPTLRIGSTICIDNNPIAHTSSANRYDREASSTKIDNNFNAANNKDLTTINSVIITQPVVLVHTKSNIVVNTTCNLKKNAEKSSAPEIESPQKTLDDQNPNTPQVEVTATHPNESSRKRIDAPNNVTPQVKVINASKDFKPLNESPKKIIHGMNKNIPRAEVTNPKQLTESPGKTTDRPNEIIPQAEAKNPNPLNESPRKTDNSPNQINPQVEAQNPKPLNVISRAKYDLNTPLKISSLLNPIYVPRSTSSTNTQTPILVKQSDVKIQKLEAISETFAKDPPNNDVISAPSTRQIKTTSSYITANKEDKKISELKHKENKKTCTNEVVVEKTEEKNKSTEEKTINELATPQLPNISGPSTSNDGRLDQHTRRRDLINQLEQSIAKGDEHAAAEAAVKLAQLRLSCSVLSFSSQIVASQSTSTPQQSSILKPVNEVLSGKVEEAIQTSSQIKKELIKDARTKDFSEKKLVQNVEEKNCKLQPPLAKMENMDVEVPGNVTLDIPMSSKFESTKNNTKSETKDTIPANNISSEASTSKGVVSKKENDDVPILVWVEDKEATRGPVQLHVRRNSVLRDLRGQAEKSLGLAARMQRWIVGKNLCSDDNTPLVTLAGPDLSAPFYLCLVESDTKDTAKLQNEQVNDLGNVYNELVKLEKQAFVANAEVFECGVCMEACEPGSGVVLRECVHSFCKACLSDTVRHSEEPAVACPATGCRGVLQEREIRALVSPDEYERWLARGLAAAESGTRNAFHCRTRDCAGWALCEPGVRRFPCPVCKRSNCVPCQAIHEGESCEQHRAKLEAASTSTEGGTSAGQPDEGTRALLDSLIARGEALECPECRAVITKKWGCDWVKCSACKTEICWVTRGRRWGPAGRGDTSAGCRCGLDGKRCHPSCGYCH